MNTELVFHPHSGERCPVPAKTIILGIEQGGFRSAGRVEAGGLIWAYITAFALDPNQLPQLDGPLEVGAEYVCRDGKIRTVVNTDYLNIKNTPITAFNDGRLVFTESGLCEPGKEFPQDIIFRLYRNTAAGVDDGTTTVANVVSRAMAAVEAGDAARSESQAHAAWLSRRMQKCAANVPKPKCLMCGDRGGVGGWDGTGYDSMPCPSCEPQPPLTDQQRESRALTVIAPNADDSWKVGVRLGDDK